MDSPRLRMRSSLDYPRPVLNQRMLTNGSHSSTGSTGSTGSTASTGSTGSTGSTALNAPTTSSSLGAPNGMAGLAGPSGLSGPTNSLMHVGSYKTRPRNLQQSSIVIPSFSPPTGAIPDTSGSVDVDDLNAIDLTGSSVSLDLNGSMDPLFFSSKKAPSSPIPKLDLGEPLMLSTNSSAANDYLVLDTSKQAPLQVYPTQPAASASASASAAPLPSTPQKADPSALFAPASGAALASQPQAPNPLQIQPQNPSQLQPQLQPQAQAQVQPSQSSQAFLQPQAPSPFQLQPPAMQSASQLQLQPQPQPQPQPQVQAPAQLQPQTANQFQIQPSSQSFLQPQSQFQPQLQPQSQPQSQFQLQPQMQSQSQLQPMRSLQEMPSLGSVAGLQSEVQMTDGLGFEGMQSPSWMPNFDEEQPVELPADLDKSELIR